AASSPEDRGAAPDRGVRSGGGALKKVLSRKDTVYEPAFFHPKRPELYLLSDEGRDLVGCAKINLMLEPRLEFVFAEEGKDVNCSYSPADDLSMVQWSYEGRKDTKVFLGALESEVRPALPEKSILAGLFRVRGKDKAILQLRSADNPGEYYETGLKAPGKLKAVSKLNRSSIEPKRFAKSWDLYTPSFDGRQIHGIVYAPEAWVKGTKRYPAIVWPHGGPDWSESHDFRAAFQFWALNGFVVFAPNFRGSLGYGKAFETLNDGDWGGGHIKDLVWGKRALEKLPYVDPDRIFIAGGSFGGYSVLSAITQYPREFKAAAAYVALANLFTFLKSIPPDPAWQAEFLKEVGDPVKDEALLKERSPFFHADRVAIPLKIWQAENDVRTVKAEMDAFTARLKELGIPVDYVVLPREGHGLSRKESLRQIMEGTVEFFRKSL
ncbi:MAG: prolyl oligopeptidase family serine peptidase, partial [Elusimicrobiota bacterium]